MNTSNISGSGARGFAAKARWTLLSALILLVSLVSVSFVATGATAAAATPSWVQGNASNPYSGTTVSVSLPNVAAGHVLVANVVVPNGFTQQGGLTGTGPAALSWTQAIRKSSGGSQITIWYAFVQTAGTYTITATATGDSPGLSVDEYSGVASTGTVVTSGGASGNSNSPSVKAAASAPANSLVFASFTWDYHKASPAATSGFTMRHLFGDATMTGPLVAEDQVRTSVGTPSASLRLPSRDGWVAVIVAFASGSGTTTATTGTVSGTVKSSSGTAISGANVAIGTLSATTSSTGSYSVANVPAGSQSVTASASGYNSATQTVSVSGGATSTANFSLTASTTVTTGTVNGAVKSSSGTAISGAKVSVGTLSATTSSTGSYSLANVPAGSETVTAAATGYNGASLSVSVTAGATSAANFSLTAASTSRSGSGLYVSGNQLLDASGKPLILRGVDRAGAEYACIQGWGIFDNNTDVMNDDAVIATMPAWKINSVNIGLNEDCWLGINGVNSKYGGTAYQQAIIHDVQTIESYGMTPVLALHWSAPGSTKATDQWPMPDADHSPAFWQSVANAFKNDPNVILRLKEEPFPNGNDDSAAAWTCWRDGGSACTDGYAEVGMQSLITTIRNTGAQNVIAVPGIQYANSLTQFLKFKPSDPLNNLMAVVDVYPNGNICGTTACYDTNYAPVAAAMPLFAGEFGESVDGNVCSVTASNTLMQWFDAHQAGYLAWVYDPWGTTCGDLSLITGDNGAAKSPNGTNYKQHLAAVQP